MQPPGDSLAIALVLQPQASGRPFRAALVTADGQQHHFETLSRLLLFLVEQAMPDAPPRGLR